MGSSQDAYLGWGFQIPADHEFPEEAANPDVDGFEEFDLDGFLQNYKGLSYTTGGNLQYGDGDNIQVVFAGGYYEVYWDAKFLPRIEEPSQKDKDELARALKDLDLPDDTEVGWQLVVNYG